MLCGGGGGGRGRSAGGAQQDSGPVGVVGGALGPPAGGPGRSPLDCEDPPRAARAPSRRPPGRGPPSAGLSSRGGLCGRRGRLRAPLAPGGSPAAPLALRPGHEVVAVAVATSVPEVHALAGGGVVVVARHPGAAGAGGARQRADGALDCRQDGETWGPLSLARAKKLTLNVFAHRGWAGRGSPPRWALRRGWCGHNSTRRW